MDTKVCKTNIKKDDIECALLEVTKKLLEEPKQAEEFFVRAKIYTPTGKLNIKYR